MDGNDRAITRFTMVGHAMFHGYEMAIPLFVVVWLVAFDASAALIGTVVAVGYALIGVGAVPSGVLSDSYGSKTLVTGSILGMGAGFLLLSLATSVWLVAVALVVWGAAASVYHPAALSLLTRGTHGTGTALAYHGAAGNVGTALGPFVAAVLLTFLEWQLVAALLAVPAVAAAAYAQVASFDETAGVDGEGTVAADGGMSPLEFLAQSKLLFASGFVVVFVIAMFGGIYYRGIFTFLPDVLGQLGVFEAVVVGGEEFDPSQYLYAGLLMIGAFGQLAGGKLSDRVTPEYAIIGAFAAQVAVSLAFVPAAALGTATFLLACAALGFFVYLYAPIVQALVGETVPADVHGLSFGYVYLGVFGVGAAGASIAGIVYTYGDVEHVFVVLAAFPAAALLLAGYLALRLER
ncbi:MFS transporter [Natrononativus amylolyticus]|uniref:MFS transporter n=1 Tax=Natrononativus amylolyticus TaxID=2963434 RepID=UPI0020CBA052|nr:MFS transporter [Natrononativus amylolyticus]